MHNQDSLSSLLKEYEIDHTPKQLDLLLRYKKLLLEWTDKTNLISRNTKDSFNIVHFLDSLLPVQWIESKGPLIDLGTGGGLPGIGIKILRPEIHVTLSETKSRKIKFLQSCIENLNLKGIDVINPSQEKPEKKYRILVSRAFGTLEKIIRESKKYLLPDGSIFAYKGLKQTAVDEINALPSRWESSIRQYGYRADDMQIERTIVTLKKRTK